MRTRIVRILVEVVETTVIMFRINLLINSISNSLMIGFNSIYPTLFISQSPSKYTTGKVGIGNVTQPLAKLHIKVEHGEQAGLFIEQNNFRMLSFYLGDINHGIKSADDIGLVFLSDNNYIFNDGNIGIGTLAPEYDLDVKGSMFSKSLTLFDKELYSENITGWVLRSDKYGNALWTDPAALNDNDWLTSGNNIYRPGGDVGIGCRETFGYRLAVNGAIIAEEVTVKVSEDWPDHVFNQDYELISINELSQYIDSEHHLPGIPSAASLLQSGLKLGQMESLLLKKIEELTLYIIQQDKKINDLESKVGRLVNNRFTE